MDTPVDLEELKPGAWGLFFVPPFSKALSYFQVSSLAPYSPSPVSSPDSGQLPAGLIDQTMAREPRIKYSMSIGRRQGTRALLNSAGML